MSETYILTAAEAANDAELWKRVERGEARVTRRWYGRPAEVASVYKPYGGHSLYALHGDHDWQADADQYDIKPDEPLTVEAIPEAEQSENSPANVERLKARIAELEGENAKLRETIEVHRQSAWDAWDYD